ncbi:PAS domain-containing protein [Nostoc sp.]|uniref:PAS domain-containing protein n=1 Tax=Nostoc sp. TaxID=1180 RepID=UPI002FF82193
MSEALPQKRLIKSVPANETQRLSALHRYRVLDTPPEVAFDRITRLAARLFNMPTVLIFLVDESRAWFKSCVGFDAREVPRDDTCSFAVLTDEPLIIPDTRLDDRFACNSFVQIEPEVRFYAGAPLLSQDGFNLGTLCLLDSQPHDPLSKEQQATLVDLAAMVVDELELRLASHKIAQVDAALLEITQGVATVTGSAFFDALVQHFANVLDTDYVYIGLVESDELKRLRTIATYAHGRIVENFEYFLQDTPCWEVLEQGKVCCYPRNVQAQFPNAPLLKQLAIESYVATPFFDSNGTPLGLLGVMDGEPLENVHLAESLLKVCADRIATELERQQVEIALHESEELKQRILDSSRDCIKVLTLNSEIVYISPGGLCLLEIDEPTTILNTIWVDRWQGKDYENAQAAIAAATLGNIGQFQGYLATAKGTPKWWDSRIAPVRDASGQVVQLVAISRDITDSKQAEAERLQAEMVLQEAHVQLESALAAGSVYTWRWNIPADRVVVNAALAHLFDVDPADATTAGLPIEFFINSMHESDRPRVLAAIQQAIETGEKYTAEYRVHTATGEERWLTARGQVEYDTAGNPIAFPGALADITERKRAESDRDRFFQMSHDMLATIDKNGYFIQLNPAWTETLGYTLQELGAQPYIEFVHPDDRAKTIAEAQVVAQGKPTIEFENRYRACDGSYRWISWNVVPFIEQGLLYCVARDITDRKQAEAAIAADLRDTQLLHDLSVQLINETDIQVLYDKIMATAIVLTGADAGTVQILDTVTQDLLLLATQGFEPNMTEHFYRVNISSNTSCGIALRNGNRTFIDFDVPESEDPDGSLRIHVEAGYLFGQSTPLIARSGKPIGMVSTHWREYHRPSDRELRFLDLLARQAADLIEQRQTQAALRDSENRFRMAIESAQLGTWDWNLITNQLIWDEGCKAMFGLPPKAESSIEVFFAGLHPEDRQRLEQVVQWTLNPASRGKYNVEYRTIGIEDRVERWIAARGQAYFDADGNPQRFIGTVLNITEQKRIEAEREQLLAREQAARTEADRANRIKDEFLAVLSHELRSPLNPILGWTRLLQNGKLTPARQIEALATIERNAKLQSQLIEDLLDISRIMQGKLTLTAAPVNLAFVISAAIETVSLAAGAKNIQITLDLDSEVTPISGDAARLQQVVWNLLTNAIKFTANGGQVTVELRRVDAEGSKLRNQMAQIRVIDTGKGINPQFLPHVFEYFRQEDASTTRRFGGLGLGLAIVRQIVELHGGTVKAKSQGEERGTTFIVQLPTLQQAILLVPEPIQTQADSETLLKNVQILLVDDDTDTREFQAFLLEQNGAKVVAAVSGLEALQVLDRLIPDVIVSDIGMPQIDGYMLMQQIRSRPPTQGGATPAIALTAYAAEIDQKRTLQAGFQMHLRKPLEPEQFVSAIVSLLKSNRY